MRNRPFDTDQIDPLDPDLFDEVLARRAGWRFLTVRLAEAPGMELLEQIADALEDCADECEYGWSVDGAERAVLVVGIRGPEPSEVAERVGWLEEELLALDVGLEVEDGAP